MLPNLLVLLLFLPQTFVSAGAQPVSVDTLLTQADQYFEQNDTTQGFQYLDSALTLSQQQEDVTNQSRVHNYYGYYHHQSGNFDQSISYYQKALTLDRIQKDTAKIISRLKNIGMSYKAKGLVTLALIQYTEALALAEAINRPASIASVSNSVGLLLSLMDQYNEALNYYDRALNIWTERHDSLRISYVYNNMGQAYYDLEQYDSALVNLQKARGLKEVINEQKSLPANLHNLGDTYLMLDSITLARQHLYQSLQLARTYQQTHEAAGVNNSLARLYLTMQNYDSAGYYLRAARQLNAEVGSRTIRLMNLKLSAQYQEAVGQAAQALAYYKQWAALQDSIYHEEHLQVVEMQAAYNLEQEEQARQQAEVEAQRAQAESQRQKRLTAVAIGLVLLFLGLSYWLFRLSKAYRRASKHNESLVREQHHRVKNNLNVIASLLRMHARRLEDEGAKQAMQESQQRIQVMELIHRQLYGQELERLAMPEYLTELVQSILAAYGSTPTLDIRVDSCLLPTDKAVPVGLIVNEVVSNACKYAFPDHAQPTLTVWFTQTNGNNYQLGIADNGPGFDTRLDHKKSFGLKLVHLQSEQLRGQYTYQNQGGTQFQLSFRV
ncbi:MAG: tetratricopeptide repeat protein [Bacteroidota bacterium]